MNAKDVLSISDSAWQRLSDTDKEELTKEAVQIIKKGARLEAAQDLSVIDMLDQDDRDLRERDKAVQRSLLGQDTNKCEDKPYTDPGDKMGDVRVTVLGDVNGDKVLESLSQSSRNQTEQDWRNTPGVPPGPVVPDAPPISPEPPVPDPQPSRGSGSRPPARIRDFLLPLALGGGLTAAGGMLANYLRPDPIPTPEPVPYDIEALPFETYPESGN